jgi:hypothetical protein
LKHPRMVEYKNFYFFQKRIRCLFLSIFFHNFSSKYII